jgi:hypothetical protein
MATNTFIDYKDDRGFYIFEPEMELVFYFIQQTFKRLNPDVPFKEDMELFLDAAAKGHLQGMLVLGWDRLLTTSEHESQMIDILEETIKDLNKKKVKLRLKIWTKRVDRWPAIIT